ncbi:MAG: hypothetical protein Q4G35_06000 [Propionibacteriaceae bacterium]|nr:hypothetical protein [Propionibacteriaceae bacterium]
MGVCVGACGVTGLLEGARVGAGAAVVRGVVGVGRVVRWTAGVERWVAAGRAVRVCFGASVRCARVAVGRGCVALCSTVGEASTVGKVGTGGAGDNEGAGVLSTTDGVVRGEGTFTLGEGAGTAVRGVCGTGRVELSASHTKAKARTPMAANAMLDHRLLVNLISGHPPSKHC